jgi:hypothetical protein
MKKQEFKYVIFLRLERRLLRSTYMLHYTLRLSLKHFSNILSMPELKLLNTGIIGSIEDIAERMLNKTHPIKETNLNYNYEKIITQVRNIFNQFTFEDKNKIHAYLFCLEHVIRTLNRMQQIVLDLDKSSILPPLP